ncbi:MAG TPA: class I SAM-dependent methyltransferase [Solirubrobacteraceae bacterium]|nr:class I SAM-dependent methyltransferase [Solirubrobacteraceae bacterium]
MRAFADLGILEPSLTAERSLAELYPELMPSGFGYMRVGLRCLASQGWMADLPTLDPETTVLRWTDSGRDAAPYLDNYAAAGECLGRFSGSAADAWSQPWDARQRESFLGLLEPACDRWRIDAELPSETRTLITTHLDAALVVPAMLWLRSADLLGDDGPELGDDELGRGIGRLLATLGWVDEASDVWTASGREAAAVAVHFGMAASYLPLLARLPDLYRGTLVVKPEPGSAEWHVHRGLNVSASAAAHTRYYADADRIFVELFDREPVDAQPRFIADMGCGDGSWLVRLHRLIAERTLRGRTADSAPLLMVGLDCNAAALERARGVLDAAGVPALLALGDVSDPDQVARTLAEHGLTMSDGLHIRAFTDHDRDYAGGDESIAVRGWSSAAYVDDLGKPLDAATVERDQVEHLRRWAPHVSRHGLVMLEAHCVAPAVARRHLGATHSVAFDAYHGYSHQYPIEHSAFLRCCRTAGLQPASHCERRYPASRPFVAVSLNRLRVASSPAALPAVDPDAVREDTWQPDGGTQLEDGRALHELLYVDGDLRHPRLWCSAATGQVVAGALEAVEARLAAARRGDTIRVLDYGAGTGLAAIELLKAWHELGIERRLERAGATLEMHLADLPSSWFAQGFELLRHCSWTRFHSLRTPGGGFRALSEVTAGRRMDAVMANMVFHLIPPRALQRVAAELAGVTAPGGRLLWSSPDLGPAGEYAVLFHDPNRALRGRWLELLDGASASAARVREAVREVRATLDARGMSEAQARADRRVFPQANAAADVAAALANHFTGGAQLERQTYEILPHDLLDTMLVPSNQGEYLPEISDRALREDVIRELMLGEVVPAMREGPACTAVGLNVQWTLGAATKSSR